MKVRLYNNTEEIIIINDIGTVTLVPSEYSEFDTVSTLLAESEQLINYISKGNIIINNFSRDMASTEGIKWLLTGAEPYLKDPKTGKMIVQETSKLPGLFTYWTSRGDLWTGDNVTIGEGQRAIIKHNIGDPLYQSIYIDFSVIDNISQMHEGYVIWKGAQNEDSCSCSIVTSVMTVSAGTNTNFNVNNGIIIPAAGNGTIQLLSDPGNTNPATGCLVDMKDSDNETLMMPAFWSADYNSETNRFENITAAPNGDGRYNMFAVEVPVVRFVNQIQLLGSGFERLQSADSDMINHGLRIKVESFTSETEGDHEWTFSATLTLQRTKTVTL